jgi:hypothetical protein
MFGEGGEWGPDAEEVSPSVRSGQPHGMLQVLLESGALRDVSSLKDDMTAFDLTLLIANKRVGKKISKLLLEYESMREYQRRKRGSSGSSPRKGSGGIAGTRVSPRKKKREEK